MKYFFTLFFTLSLLVVNAQSVILFENDSVSRTHTNADISSVSVDFGVDLYFKNNTTDTILVNWKRVIGQNCPLAWDIMTTGQLFTNAPNINESPAPLLLAPADSHFLIRQVYFPKTVAGCCDIRLIFTLDGAPNVPIDTGYYHIDINGGGCIATSILTEEKEQFNIYPNPTFDVLYLENGDLIETIECIDITGKIYQLLMNSKANQIDISALPGGIYFCRIRSKTGNIVVEKMVKY